MEPKIEPLSSVIRQLVFHTAVLVGSFVLLVAAFKFVWGLL